MAASRSSDDYMRHALQRIAQEPSSYMVAVLKTDAIPEDAKAANYLWFECRSGTTVGAVRQQYSDRSKAGNGIIFHHQTRVLEDQTPIRDLDEYQDHLVIVEAVATKDQPGSAAFGNTKIASEPQVHTQSSSSVPPTPQSVTTGPSDLLVSGRPTQRQALYSPSPTMAEGPTRTALDTAEGGQKEAQTIQLQKLIHDASPDVLEKGVEEGVKLLDQLRIPMLPLQTDNPDAQEWLRQIDGLKKQATKTRTVIGVMENTGAGKSSVINAVLNQDRIVPTNCMRACTAVVTEISYNSDDIPYRAEIEFIQSSDWEKELKILFQDLLDGDGNISRECCNADTDAGIAYAKVAAVYPTKSREEIESSSIDGLLEEVSYLLGRVREIKDTKASHFYTRLRRIVDSKERNGIVKRENGIVKRENGARVTRAAKEVAYWPLIKVLRIYVKSPVLSTGLVLVDLPGVSDANAARASVAEGYMKQCIGLWIVTPITRAVDDKAAQSLLGQSFKRPLKMDGSVGSVTFVCSKADDIDKTEVQESIDMYERLLPLRDRAEELRSEQKALDKELRSLNTSKIMYDEVVNDLDDEMESWHTLIEDAQAGIETFAPAVKPTRKRGGAQQNRSRKRQCPLSDAAPATDSDIAPGTSSIKEDDDGEEQKIACRPLGLQDIMTKITEVRARIKEARKSKSDVDLEIQAFRKQQDEVRTAQQQIEADVGSECIAARNDYVKETIRRGYVNGIKDLDRELAAEADENFRPGDDLRDYDKLAREFPVFCVSSRGYQKMKGRLRNDKLASAFRSVEETEIPMLQKHCVKLTEAGRIANSHNFLNSLVQLLNSLALWASGGNVLNGLTEDQKATQERQLRSGMDRLKGNLDKTIRDTADELRKELAESIFSRCSIAVQSAAKAALETIHHWAKRINKEDRSQGGFWWSTYQAACRREGVYSFQKQPINWNDALADPMLRKIVPGWEKMFTRRLPSIMTSYPRRLSDVLSASHQEIDREARTLRVNEDGIKMLQRQVECYDCVFKEHAKAVGKSLDLAQKDISREFVPIIQNVMRPAYVICGDERGFKTFAKMKEHMDTHVTERRASMFQDSFDEVRRRLLTLVNEQEQIMADRVDELFHGVQQDYVSVLIGGNVPNALKLREARQEMRKEVMKTLDRSDEIFENAANSPEKGLVNEGESEGLQDVATEIAEANHESNPEAQEVSDSELSDLSMFDFTELKPRSQALFPGLRGRSNNPEINDL